MIPGTTGFLPGITEYWEAEPTAKRKKKEER